MLFLGKYDEEVILSHPIVKVGPNYQKWEDGEFSLEWPLCEQNLWGSVEMPSELMSVNEWAGVVSPLPSGRGGHGLACAVISSRKLLPLLVYFLNIFASQRGRNGNSLQMFKWQVIRLSDKILKHCGINRAGGGGAL